MTERHPPSSTDALESRLRAFAHASAPEPPPHVLDDVLRQTQTAPQAPRWSFFSWPLLAAATAIGLAVAAGFSGWLQVGNRPTITPPVSGPASAFASAFASADLDRSTPTASPTPPLATVHGEWLRVALPDPSGDVFGGSSAEDVVPFKGAYVAVGAVNASCCADGDPAANRGVVWTSSDGAHWDMRDDLPAFQHSSLHQVISVDGRLVVAGTYAEPQEGQNGIPVAALWTSSDGTSWERVPGDVPGMMTLGPHGLVGIITEPSDARTDPTNWFATSSDGISWERDSIGWRGDVHDVAARADGIFVAVGASSEDRPGEAAIWYTSEVGGWIEHTTTDAPEAWLASVTVFDGQFLVAVNDPKPQPDGSDRGEVWVTDDPTTGSWTSIANLGTMHPTGIFALEDALVAVGTDESEALSDATAWVSTDLVHWGQVSRDEAFTGVNNEVAAVIPMRQGGLMAVGWYYEPEAGHIVPVAWLEHPAS